MLISWSAFNQQIKRLSVSGPVWSNGSVFVIELSGSGFESSCLVHISFLFVCFSFFFFILSYFFSRFKTLLFNFYILFFLCSFYDLSLFSILLKYSISVCSFLCFFNRWFQCSILIFCKNNQKIFFKKRLRFVQKSVSNNIFRVTWVIFGNLDYFLVVLISLMSLVTFKKYRDFMSYINHSSKFRIFVKHVKEKIIKLIDLKHL